MYFLALGDGALGLVAFQYRNVPFSFSMGLSSLISRGGGGWGGRR